MILPTHIEPTNRGAAFEIALTATRAPRMELRIKSPKIGERWLAIVGSEDAGGQSLSFVRRFAKNDAEIHSVTPSGSDPASEVRRLAMELGVDWLSLVAHRGSGVMSLFLRGDVERTLRASPCPVICIPESLQSVAGRPSASEGAFPIRRVLAPIKLSLHARRQVENAVAVAERFGAKLDLLGVDELLRNPDGSRIVSHREAKRLQTQAIKKELAKLAEEVVPNPMRGRIRISPGFPLFYATTRWARELNADLVVLAVPARLWTNQGRIDVGTERILHRVECPVICIPEHGELCKDRHEVLSRVRQRHRRRNWHTPSRLSLRHGLRAFPKCKDFSATRHELVAPTTNLKRFDAYET
ncbi:MAG: universal stress protein [Verrucomicrobia bacterium]|nr:universal stress protein [Verrucomicrobiota bacterium]